MMIRRLGLALSVSFVALAAAVPAFAQGKDSLVATLNSNVNSLYPGRGVTAEEYNVGMLLFNGLVRITEDLKLEPELATSWSANTDATEWTFKLRDGVKFHNGKVFAAEDVVHTFALIGDPQLASRARSTAEMVKAIETPDPLTVKFVLHQPYGSWPEMLIERHLKIVPKGVAMEEMLTKPVGTGPFVFESYTPGDKLTATRNPNYWEAGLPKLARVTLRIMPEDASKIAALNAGDIDILWNVPLEAIKELEGSKTIKVDSVPTSTWDGIVMKNDLKPFSDVRVRRAVLKALDKEQLVQFALFGQGAPTHTPIPPNHAFYDPALPVKPDVAGARKLLAEAGYAKGFKITLNVPVGRPTRERAAVAIQQMLRPVGIEVALERVPYSRWGATVAGKAPFYMDGYLSRPTIDTATYPWYHSAGSWNPRMWNFKSERIDEVLDKARLATGDAERKALYQQFQRDALEDAPGAVMYVINFATAYRPALKGYRTHPYSWMDLRQAHFE